ncbi:MAG: hypothetical protein IJF71_07165 [Clostridia bacterium]|nr:hypothetical protein [Clostridia bacterium]
MKKYRIHFSQGTTVALISLTAMMLVAFAVNLTLLFTKAIPIGQNIALSVAFSLFFALAFGFLLYGILGSHYVAKDRFLLCSISLVPIRMYYAQIVQLYLVQRTNGKRVAVIELQGQKRHFVQLPEAEAQDLLSDILHKEPRLALQLCREEEEEEKKKG